MFIHVHLFSFYLSWFVCCIIYFHYIFPVSWLPDYSQKKPINVRCRLRVGALPRARRVPCDLDDVKYVTCALWRVTMSTCLVTMSLRFDASMLRCLILWPRHEVRCAPRAGRMVPRDNKSHIAPAGQISHSPHVTTQSSELESLKCLFVNLQSKMKHHRNQNGTVSNFHNLF